MFAMIIATSKMNEKCENNSGFYLKLKGKMQWFSFYETNEHEYDNATVGKYEWKWKW